MGENYITINFSNEGTRNEVRMRVVEQFAKETFGFGKDEFASKYTYYVENLKGGNRVYLRRPANLHNGFDFLVCVENMNFSAQGIRTRNFPKHDDIITDLKKKKENESGKYMILFDLIKQVYSCKDIYDTDLIDLNFRSGFSVELILKILKWFFIEQDIRYWNYSGRDMLWNAINKI